MRREKRNNIIGYVFILPTIVLFIYLTFIPFVYGIGMSFTKWDGFSDPVFVGVENYIRLFHDNKVFEALSHNVFYAIGTVTAKVILGFAFAFILSKKLRGVNTFRSILFTPVVLSYVAIGTLWKWMFNPGQGLINSVLGSIGLMSAQQPIAWLGDEKLALLVVMFVDVWKWLGYHMVLFLAGLQAIPDDLYEAAKIDGASGVQQLRCITIPMMRSVILTNVVFCLTGSFSVFDLVMSMTNGGPYGKTEVIAKYIYDTAFGSTGKFGYSTAISVFVFVIVLCITLVILRAMRKAEENES